MRDIIRAVINYFACSWNMGKIRVYDKIIIENLKKKENMEIKETFACT